MPSIKVTHHFLPDMPPRVSALRSLGAYTNVFSTESFMDELARAASVGRVEILRVVAAADTGEVVNPGGIENQIQGGIIQSASWTLTEEITFDRTRITSRDWGGYPILRFPDVPQRIEVHVVPRPGAPFLGTGEVAQGPTPALLANAIADATGVRIRQLPLSWERVRKALAT